jgi:deferrochelatase/peroxidase EfeB
MPLAPQPGIVNRPPDHAIVAAYALAGADAAVNRQALERLREVMHRELRSDLDDTTPQSPKDQPSAETGELGFADHYDRYHLTITIGFAAGAYDKLGIATEDRPQDLIAIPWGQLGDAPQGTAENGDIVLQVCSDSVYVNEHVVRRVGEELADVLTSTWTVAGHQRHTSRAGRTNRQEGRALIGFLDGTSNLNPRRDNTDAKLVFVDPADVPGYPPAQPTIDPGQPSPYGGPQPPTFPGDLRAVPTREPEWTKGGSYMVVRASTFDASAWDRRTLGDQEHVIGRFKVSGQALDQPDDPGVPIAEPNFPADPSGSVTPLNSHIRKANPRGPGDDARRIFRRGYPLVGALGAGGLQRGLLFVCFGRTITTQFEFITRAWTTNPNFPQPGAGIDRLREIETVLCGGYFFVPALRRANQPWSFVVPDATPASA